MASVAKEPGRRLRVLARPLNLFSIAVVMAWASTGGLITNGPAAAATIPQATFVDFAQCANDKPPSTSTGCPGGWINGILQASNSHYAEDDVVPQRLEVKVPAGSPATARTITLQYQARKGTTSHAYDSLATWNFTQTTANRCDGLSASDCVGGAASTFPIPFDCTEVAPATSGGINQGGCGSSAMDVTARHQRTGQVMTMYGGTITAVSTPVHSAQGSDDYAEVVITYDVASTASDQLVQLLFGGHLAAGVRVRGWGSGLGSGSINGGPYHFKFIETDGQSIGNRDNQISAGGILAAPTITTQLSSGAVAPGTAVTDSATLIDAASGAGGTVTYKVFPGSTASACGGTPVFTSIVTVTNGIVPNSAPFTPTVAQVGSYEWQAVYSGDAADLSATSDCGTELLVVSQSSSTTTTNATLSSGRVGELLTIGDTATVTGSGTIVPTGTVTFKLYSDGACQAPVSGVGGDVTLSAAGTNTATATYSTTFTPQTSGTYYWAATYSGDNKYQGSKTGCADSTEALVISKNSTTTATQASSTPATGQLDSAMSLTDVATVTGSDGVNPTGTVTFTLYSDGTCTNAVSGPGGTETLVAGTAPKSAATHTVSWTPTKAGTYYWAATYSGDTNYASSHTGCADATEAVTVAKATSTTTTAASPGSAALGTALTISDTATVTGVAGTAPTGNVTFTLYASANCTPATAVAGVGGTVALTSASPTSATATATRSTSWTPTIAGTYYWYASYGGDGNYNSSHTGCADTPERLVVGLGTTSTTTQAASTPATGHVGSPMALTDVATVTGQGSVTPTGSVTFTLYASTNCSSPVSGVGGSANLVAGTAPAATATHTASWTPSTAGTYYWHASYPGDANYGASTTGCADATEAVIVAKVAPSITTNLSSSTIKAGSSIHDTATLNGASSNASGTVTYSYFTNTSCDSGKQTVGTVNVSAGDVPNSPDVQFPASGTFYWQADYSGDGNNEPAVSECTSEKLVVEANTPTLTTAPSPTIGTVGVAMHDTATVTSAVAVSGTVSFALYGPGDTTCQTDLVAGQASFKSIALANGTATSPDFTTTTIGVYQWVASYSGDAANSAVKGSCNDTSEQVTTGAVLAATGGFDLSLMLLAPPFLLLGGVLLLIARRRQRRPE